MKIRTLLPLLELDSNEVVCDNEQAEEYQRILSLAQKACIMEILQKNITSAKLKKIYVDERCISLEICRLSIKFSLNLYLFQFVTCCGTANSQLAEINISRDEDKEEIIALIREVIFSKTNALMVGFSSEELISQILSEMKKSHKIISFRKSFVGEDINGVDFFFSLRDHRNQVVEIPLQIKTSARGQRYHRLKFKDISSLFLSETDSREEVIKKIIKIGEAYCGRQKIINL